MSDAETRARRDEGVAAGSIQDAPPAPAFPPAPSLSPSGAPPMLSGFRAATLIFKLGALAPLGQKKGLVLFALTFLPAALLLIANLAGVERGGGSYFFLTVVLPFYHLIAMLVFVLVGCAALGDDVESRALVYDLICPVPRSAVYTGRYAAYLAASLLLTLPALVATFGVCMGRYGMDALAHSLPLLWAVLAGAVAGAAVYGAAFILLSILIKRAVLVALIGSICIEVVVANIPFRICHYSVLFHLRNAMASLSGDSRFFPASADEWRRLITDMPRVTLAESALVLAALWLVFFAAGLFAFRRKQFP